MKKIIYILSLLIIFVNFAYSQWIQQIAIQNIGLYDIDFYNSNTGFASGGMDIGGGRIYKTTNRGASWIINFVGPAGNIFSISAYGIGTFATKIFKSTNMGNNWTEAQLPAGVSANSLCFLDYNTGYLAGVFSNYGAVLKTTNHGTTFEIIIVPTSPSLNSIDIEPNQPNSMVVTSYTGRISRTTNGGTNWTTVTSPYGLNEVCYTSNNTVFVCGNGGLILKSTDDGNNWTVLNTNTSETLNSIEMITPALGYACGTNGVVIKTFDGGVTWHRLSTPVNSILYSAYSFDVNRIYICGDSGSIIATTNGGGDPIVIEPISSKVPDNFSLSQNYPNPFNPATNIEFSIAKSTNVKIAVYDLLGREVSVLTDGFLIAGEYKVTWDGSNASSGTYFYKITAGEFTETHKMILIK